MKCPFLEEVLVRYCKAYPTKKGIPSSSSDKFSLCLNEGYTKCPEYQRLAKPGKEKSKMKTQKVRGDPKFFPPNYWRICQPALCPACVYEPICVAASLTERKVSYIEGFMWLEDLYYHDKHMWVKVRKDGTARLGMDDFAQKLLGEVTSIDSPEQGIAIREGEYLLGIKCGEREARLRSPISSKIKRVNEKLIEKASLLNEDPYRQWILRIEPLNLQDSLDGLLFGDEAKAWLERDIDRLRYKIDSDIGVTVADGGALIQIVEKIDEKEWGNLIKDFLFV